jgi:hypothetical protein
MGNPTQPEYNIPYLRSPRRQRPVGKKGQNQTEFRKRRHRTEFHPTYLVDGEPLPLRNYSQKNTNT